MDVYDEVDRRENDAGEPGGHGSLGHRGQWTCQPGRAGTWVALSPGLGRGTWLGLLGRPAREPRQLGAQQPALLAGGQSCPEEAASLLPSPTPWTGAPLRPAAALSGSLPSRAPPPPSRPQQIPAQRQEGASSFCCQSPAGLARLCPDPALHPVSRDHLCSEHPCSGPCGPGKELGRRCSGPPAPACPAGPASVDSPCPSPTVWLATQNHSTLVTERSAVPFLPVNPEYSATRNQVSGLDGAWGHLLPCWVTTLWGPALPFLAGRPLFAALPHSWPRPRPGCGMWEWGGSCPVSPG